VAAIALLIRLAMLLIPFVSGYWLIHGYRLGLEKSQGAFEFTLGLLAFVFLGLPGLVVGYFGVRFDAAGADGRIAGVWFIVAGAVTMLTAVGISLLSQLLGPFGFILYGMFATGAVSASFGLVAILTGLNFPTPASPSTSIATETVEVDAGTGELVHVYRAKAVSKWFWTLASAPAVYVFLYSGIKMIRKGDVDGACAMLALTGCCFAMCAWLWRMRLKVHSTSFEVTGLFRKHSIQFTDVAYCTLGSSEAEGGKSWILKFRDKDGRRLATIISWLHPWATIEEWARTNFEIRENK
jgi:hypothetical protein